MKEEQLVEVKFKWLIKLSITEWNNWIERLNYIAIK